MKKIICLLLCLVLVLGLAACRNTNSEAPDTEAPDSEITTSETPASIMERCGLDVDVVPSGAENITYRTIELDTDAGPLLTAEAAFTLDGIQYHYRLAPDIGVVTDAVYDLSQLDIPDAVTETAMVGWCDATLVYQPDGSGKILWYDIAPGLIYSLDMDQDASAEALLSMAELLYTPAQGEVG